MTTYTAFDGETRIASATLDELALAVKSAGRPALVFNDETGAQLDLDLRGNDAEIRARYRQPETPVRRGRPKLGVVAREVTLLPRHWDWLNTQPSGTSATLRRLVDDARRGTTGVRAAADAAYRFMAAMAGNLPGFEEAARALYAGDGDRFRMLTRGWPVDIRDHSRRLAAPALAATDLAIAR